jgi:organic radical activating enzyme
LNKPKLTFEYLTIEVTRKCNMRCAHCLRGDAQDVDIDYKHIDDLLDQVEVIGHLDVTGGEPTLNLDALEYILNGLCKRGIPLCEFGLYTNGLIYSERFVKLIKWCKQIIDVSCSNCLKNGNEYQPQRYLSRCNVGVSLDRYHEQHDICMENYHKYKAALSDYADIRMILRGNNPKRYGRARHLELPMLNMDSVFDLSKKQRIELLSKDCVPACPDHDKYHMFYEDQKIVCCQIFMNAFGMISSEYGGAWEYENCDAYPKICAANDSIWDSIIEYNKDKIPCAKFQTIQTKMMRELFQELSWEELIEVLNKPDSKDEKTHYTKMVEAEEKERLDKLEHPKSLIEAIRNFNGEYENYLKAQENLRKAKEHEAKNWAQIIAEANYHAYYDGDKRGDTKPKDQASTAKIKLPAMKAADGIRCFYCGKVIQYQGRNIHFTETEQGLQCQYCKHINTVWKGR